MTAESWLGSAAVAAVCLLTVAGLESARGYPYSSTTEVPTRMYDDAMGRSAMLIRLIEHENPGPEATAEAVLAALHDPDLGVRQIAVSNLDLAGSDPRVLPALRQLVDTALLSLRWLAVREVAMLPAAIVGLPDEARKSAADPDPLIRRALLSNIASGPGVAEVARPLLIAALLGPDLGDRMAAAQSWARLKLAVPRSIFDRLAAGMNDADETVAGAASFALNALWDKPVEEQVRRLAGSGPWGGRVHAADLLRKHGLEVPLSCYAGVFAEGGEVSQLYACGTLSRLTDEEVAERLSEAGQSRYATVRQAAVYALETTRNRASSRSSLAGLLGNSDANVRYRAAVVLGRIGPGAARDTLAAMAASDPDEKVRSASAIASAVDFGSLLPPLAGIERPPAEPGAEDRGFTEVRDGALQVGTRKQLLVDDFSLASLGGAVRVFHKFKKDPDNPILEQQFPWEYDGTTVYMSSVDYEEGTKMLRLYYNSSMPNPIPYQKIGGPDLEYHTLQVSKMIALSADGIHWTRPNVGRFEMNGSKANNLVGLAKNIVRLREPFAGQYHYASYVQSGSWRQHTPFLMSASFSPDGIGDWTPYRPVLPGSDDVSTIVRDDLGQGYMGFEKYHMNWWWGKSFGGMLSPKRILKSPTAGGRAFASVFGPSPVDLRRGELSLYPGPEDDRRSFRTVAETFPGVDSFEAQDIHAEIYLVTPFPYEGIYFAVPSVFFTSGEGGSNDDGPLALSLFFSRDRTGASGWTPNGGDHLEPILDLGRWGEWDSTRMYGDTSIVVVNDQIVLYYSGFPDGHEPEGFHIATTAKGGPGRPYYRPAIGRATLRLDGFASLRAGEKEAAILTRKLVFRGDRLLINAQGQVSAEILDGAGCAIPGFEREHCATFRGDALRHSLSWPGANLGGLAGKVVQIRFFLKNGDFYSYRFYQEKASGDS